jgi:radical SAM protein with 4Fe4S-binding SPASM domain
VFPCGYLPVPAGDIRRQRLKEIWDGSGVFGKLRDPGLLLGKCGGCEFKTVCGGCRARAFGVAGDWLGEEPFCTWIPGTRESRNAAGISHE